MFSLLVRYSAANPSLQGAASWASTVNAESSSSLLSTLRWYCVLEVDFSYSTLRHSHLNIQLVVKLSEQYSLHHHRQKDALQRVGNSGQIQANRRMCSFFHVRRHATRECLYIYIHRRRNNAGASLKAEDKKHVPSKLLAVVISS